MSSDVDVHLRRQAEGLVNWCTCLYQVLLVENRTRNYQSHEHATMKREHTRVVLLLVSCQEALLTVGGANPASGFRSRRGE